MITDEKQLSGSTRSVKSMFPSSKIEIGSHASDWCGPCPVTPEKQTVLTFLRAAPTLAMMLFLGAIAGCAHPPATVSAPDPSQSERRLQLRVEILQAEVRAMGQKVFACEQAYWSSMSPDWRTQLLTTKVQADHPGARIRHLEALQELLELDLKSLQSELRVYENFLKPVPPTVPRATPPAVPPRK